MDIIGRYVGIWVTRDEIEAIFGFDPASIARVFMLGGKVFGESPGVGLWIELDVVSIGGTPHELFPDLAKEKPRRLVRWEYIRAAELFEQKVDLEQVVGFRPHAVSAAAA